MTSTPANVAPGSLVRVGDADWLVTNASPTQDGVLIEVTGLSELVWGTRAAFCEHLDKIVAYDPRADDSPKCRRSRRWLEPTLLRTPIPLGEGRLSVATQKGKSLADVIPSPEAVAADNSDPWLSLILAAQVASLTGGD